MQVIFGIVTFFIMVIKQNFEFFLNCSPIRDWYYNCLCVC